MHKITAILAAIALTTSCSVQLDSQYGLRLEPRRITSPERLDRSNNDEVAEPFSPSPNLTKGIEITPVETNVETIEPINSFESEHTVSLESNVAAEANYVAPNNITTAAENDEESTTHQDFGYRTTRSMPYWLQVALVSLALIAAFLAAIVFFFIGLAWVLLYELYWLDEIFILWGLLLMAASVALAIVARNITRRLIGRG